MSTELNAAISRAWYLDLFYDNNLSLADDIHTAGYTNHDPYAPPGGFDQGPQAARRVVTLYRTAFPDLFFTIEDQVAEDDRVATRWTVRGTHSGMLNGMPPTGNTAVVGGITIERYGNSKLAESHVSFDMLGLLIQLGIIPTPYVALVARRMRGTVQHGTALRPWINTFQNH